MLGLYSDAYFMRIQGEDLDNIELLKLVLTLEVQVTREHHNQIKLSYCLWPRGPHMGDPKAGGNLFFY